MRFRQYIKEDVRGKVKIGKVTLDTENDFQRQILNQYEPNTSKFDKASGKTYYGGSGLNNPITDEEVAKIYKMSKKFWKKGGIDFTLNNGDKVFVELSYSHHPSMKGFYASWSYAGYVGSTKLFKTPDQAITSGFSKLKKQYPDKKEY